VHWRQLACCGGRHLDRATVLSGMGEWDEAWDRARLTNEKRFPRGVPGTAGAVDRGAAVVDDHGAGCGKKRV
jgi:hypothetical protein